LYLRASPADASRGIELMIVVTFIIAFEPGVPEPDPYPGTKLSLICNTADHNIYIRVQIMIRGFIKIELRIRVLFPSSVASTRKLKVGTRFVQIIMYPDPPKINDNTDPDPEQGLLSFFTRYHSFYLFLH
jgi:hypothetical protein